MGTTACAVLKRIPNNMAREVAALWVYYLGLA